MALVEGSTNTITQVDAALKQLYKDMNEASHYFDDRPALGLMPKDEGLGGRDEPIVINYTRTGGVSSTFSTAQTIAAARPKKIEDFLITPIDHFSLVRVPGNTLARVRNQSMGWEELVASLSQKGLDDAEENLANRLETYMYRNGKGVLCQISAVSENPNTPVESSDASANELTLTNPEDAVLFELGDYVEPCDSAGTEEATATCKVIKIDIPNKKIQVDDVDTNGNEAFDASDYICFSGDAYTLNGASAAYKTVFGYEAWIPATAPTTGDSFLGVDRSASSRLYGKYYDKQTGSREGALFEALTDLGLEGGSPTLGLMCFTEYRALLEDLETRKDFVHMNAMREEALVANIGYEAVKIHGPKSVMNVTSSIKMLPSECVCVNPQDWKLHSAGPLLSLEDYDGLTILRLPTEDAYEGRMASRCQVSCKKPGRQGRVKVAGA